MTESLPNSHTDTISALDGIREFAGSGGTRWTVLEIANPGFSQRLASLFPHPERRAGWLLFESPQGEKRRLSPYPRNWRDLTADELDALFATATPAGPEERRRATDAD